MFKPGTEMDIATYLQCFESRFSSYTGDDPLDPWDKFVEYLEQRFPADGGSGMSVVVDSLVQRFLTIKRYANDIRYVNYCIRCASSSSDPVAVYSHVFSQGVGSRTAALYLAWAQQCEQKGLNEQADAVYQKAMENQAQPADTVLHEYRQFQARVRGHIPGSGVGVSPLQTSHLTNQMSSHRETVAQGKGSGDCLAKPPAIKTIITLSRSENSGVTRSCQGSGVQTVSQYMKDELVCEGSEFSFEEVRARKYFCKLRERKEKEHREKMEKQLREQEEDIRAIKSTLEKVEHSLETCASLTSQPPSQKQVSVSEAPTHQNQNPTRHPRLSNRLSSRLSRGFGLTLHTESPFMQEDATTAAAAVPEPPQEQHTTRPLDTNTLTAEISQHASVLADRIHVPQPAAPLGATRQTPHNVQPGSFDQTNLPLHRAACVSAVNTDVLRQDNPVQTDRDVSQVQEPEEKLNVSQGASVNLSHITPNNSLGYVQATPSRVLPSPTVNTREALDVIMDMFQAPTLLDDPFNSTSGVYAAESEYDAGVHRNGASAYTNPPSAAPFTIFQDDNKENSSAASRPAVEKPKAVRALAEIPVSKPERPNETPSDLMPDESTMWGARYNALHSLAACPNSTTDFAPLAQFVSTPFTHKTPFSSNFYQDQENHCDGSEADDDAYISRPHKKLSPIMEQSPSEEKLSETGMSQLLPASVRQGTIVGEALPGGQHCLTTSSITMVQPPPPAVLSFRDHTLCPAEPAVSRTTGPGWEVFMSPEQPPRPGSLTCLDPGGPVRQKAEPFEIMEDVDECVGAERKPADDVPMSPESVFRPDWMSVRSPEATVQPDLDAFLSPPRPTAHAVPSESLDVPMSPQQPQLCHDEPMSPAPPPPPRFGSMDEPMSPDRELVSGADMSMNTTTTTRRAAEGAVQLVSDPWNEDLICHLLSTLSPPLTSHPHCITWQCNLPSITPKMTISMGKASLRVDAVLGEGAFAKVYQATDPATSDRMVLKVQKPANPWEFYIDTQLDARLQPDVRHLYARVRSAHLFHNGSVLLGELHNYGTLLNAVNMYKGLSEKLMPQPLVMYFTVCILHMVEQLHRVHIIHADIKPDNFLLGERFLENKCFDPDNVDHGLVLIDLGQSIDMEFFPEGTAFTAKCLTSGFQCTEMLSGKQWSYQTDYFGIAGTVYCMLFGTYMQVTNEDGVWRTNAAFRRNPHSDLWLRFFHTLLNVPDCSALPSLRSLRRQLTCVLQRDYSSKLSTLKSRLVVLLLESRKAARR